MSTRFTNLHFDEEELLWYVFDTETDRWLRFKKEPQHYDVTCKGNMYKRSDKRRAFYGTFIHDKFGVKKIT